ncbi:hypothetical protein KSP40_PGU011928 [Platanthera guangdongensis]|uniref:Uncharacterized protein n=1 Tax=Platanthera guangdongensis TaxID=2320717 RepID=A0ABR2LID9_9ASPA
MERILEHYSYDNVGPGARSEKSVEGAEISGEAPGHISGTESEKAGNNSFRSMEAVMRAQIRVPMQRVNMVTEGEEVQFVVMSRQNKAEKLKFKAAKLSYDKFLEFQKNLKITDEWPNLTSEGHDLREKFNLRTMVEETNAGGSAALIPVINLTPLVTCKWASSVHLTSIILSNANVGDTYFSQTEFSKILLEGLNSWTFIVAK